MIIIFKTNKNLKMEGLRKWAQFLWGLRKGIQFW